MESKPFPWKCLACGERTVVETTMTYSTPLLHDGRSYEVVVPNLAVPRCEGCGKMLLTDDANRRISAAFRTLAGLLSPEEIRRGRERLGLTQRQLAANLAIGEATLSRWESGWQIQQRSLDRLLRLYFISAEVRELLGDDDRLRQRTARALAENGREEARAANVARLTTALDRLPPEKERAAIGHLTELLRTLLPDDAAA